MPTEPETVQIPDPAGPRASRAALIYLSVVAYPHSEAKRELFRNSIITCMLRGSVRTAVLKEKPWLADEDERTIQVHADRYAAALFDEAALAAYRRRARDAEAAVKRGTRMIGRRANVAQVAFFGALAKESRVSSYTRFLTRFDGAPDGRCNVHARYWNPALPVLHLAAALLPSIQHFQRENETRLFPIYQLVEAAESWLPQAIAQAERLRLRLKEVSSIRLVAE